MFVQSHIQRNRHPPGTSTNATFAATNVPHQHQNHRHQHRKHNNSQQHQQRHQSATAEGPKPAKSQEPAGVKRETSQVARSKAIGASGSKISAFGRENNRFNSFFSQHINQEHVIRALEELDKTGGRLIGRIANARDDVELLEQLELVEWKLVAERALAAAAAQAATNKKDSSTRQKVTVECRQRRYVKSISLVDLHSQAHENKATSQEPNLRKRSTTINSILKRQSGSILSVESSEKWTQVNESLDQIHCHNRRAVTAQPISSDSRGLIGRVLDLPRTLWNIWITRAASPAGGNETRPESRLNLGKNLRVVAWFWVNFIAFQYETLRQVYLVLRASRSRGQLAQNEMAAPRSEYAVGRNGLNHGQYIHSQTPLYQHHAQTVDYTSPSIALVGPIEPRLVQYQNEVWAHGQAYHGRHAHQYQQHQQQPNHVHVHNHTSLANHYDTHYKSPLLECNCAYQRPSVKGPTPMPRAGHSPPQKPLAPAAANLQLRNGVTHQNVIAMQHQQQQQQDNPSELRWQWHLRHTVDGSPITAHRLPAPFRSADYTQPSYVLADAPSLVRPNYRCTSFLEGHTSSISSPTLLEPGEPIADRRRRDISQLRPAGTVNISAGLPAAKPERLVEWRLGYSSDELSVISDHKPDDQSSLSMSERAERRVPASAHKLTISQRRPQALLAARQGQYAGWSSMDSEQSVTRYHERRQAELHRASLSARRGAANRLVAQSSLTTGHTSSINGESLSPAASLHNQPLARAETMARGGASSGVESNNQQPQPQQQNSSRRASPLAKVSLSGAKRRLGFKRRDGGLNSLSVHRSEEVFPGEAIGGGGVLRSAANQPALSSGERRRQYANTTGSSSLNDSSFDSAPPFGVPRSPWFNQFRASPDPKVCFVDGLGAGQIASRQALVSPYLGDIQLGLSDRRGVLEVEVIRVRQLQLKPAAKRLPSPYVKVYLMRDKKCLAKFKTTQVRETLDPLYQQQFIFRDDYSNCVLQVIVWGDYGKKDKKSLMGAVQIYINDLDMSNLVIGWYKLFNAPSMTNSSLASSSKAIRQTMSSSRLASDFCSLSSWQLAPPVESSATTNNNNNNSGGKRRASPIGCAKAIDYATRARAANLTAFSGANAN